MLPNYSHTLFYLGSFNNFSASNTAELEDEILYQENTALSKPFWPYKSKVVEFVYLTLFLIF